MANRRNILAAVVSGTTVVAGCLGAAASGGTDSTFGELDLSIPADAVAVARETAESTDSSGRVDATATVYEREADGSVSFILLTEYRVSPLAGAWNHAAFRERHDWTVHPGSVSVRDHSTNTAATDADDPPLSVETASSTERGRWTVHLTPPQANSVTYRFLTWVSSAAALSDGDRIVEARPEAAFEEDGILGDDTALAMESSLVYGAIED
ncbi:hypothetical protein [Natronorubrum sp. DTA7]|uniref:hypothetical protein n=1 Tax=Natronorubrum sp. DTA7 TaxID=3447016 RepID=UPI003F87CEEE